MNNRKKREIESDMESMGFDKMTRSGPTSKRASATEEAGAPEDDAAAAAAADGRSYEYLLSMAISSLTYERVRHQ